MPNQSNYQCNLCEKVINIDKVYITILKRAPSEVVKK